MAHTQRFLFPLIVGPLLGACGLIQLETTVNGKKTTYGEPEPEVATAPVPAPAPQAPSAQRVALAPAAAAQHPPQHSTSAAAQQPTHHQPVTEPVVVAPPPSPAPSAWLAQRLAQVRAAAAAEKLDFSVLGIALAEPFRVPPCSSVTPPKEQLPEPTFQDLLDTDYLVRRGTDPTPTQRCDSGSRDPNSTPWGDKILASAGVQLSASLPPGASRRYLYLPPEERPSWFSPGVMGLAAGLVAVIVAEGQVIAVEFNWLKAEDAEFTLQAIQTKYPTLEPQRARKECVNNYGARTPTFDVVWSTPTLRVTYALGCGTRESTLVFETAVVDDLRQRANAARVAAEPKL